MNSKLGKRHYLQLNAATHGAARTRRPVLLRPGDSAILRRLRQKQCLALATNRRARPFPAAG
jgi:hypothetical protein